MAVLLLASQGEREGEAWCLRLKPGLQISQGACTPIDPGPVPGGCSPFAGHT